MKLSFYCSILGLLIFEVLRVYLIMPLPGSQEMNSIDLAYFLHEYRWFFRIGLVILAIYSGSHFISRKQFILPLISVGIVGAFAYLLNFKMSADHMFHPPQVVNFGALGQSPLEPTALVIGYVQNGVAKAYPIRYLTFHHQVQDQIGGTNILVTYCSVCRTGRVYSPVINGKPEHFRLVGMDHFNAMFEDETTGSWWQQATGTAITGKLKGTQLAELQSYQLTLANWMLQYPKSLVMLPDPSYISSYDQNNEFEEGKDKSSLTGTDTSSWNKKSWVAGITIGNLSKAYDWNTLRLKQIINDSIGAKKIVLVLADDERSFIAFENPNGTIIQNSGDTLITKDDQYTFSGKSISGQTTDLKPLKVYQEFWHSWKNFHPQTLQYK